MKIRQVARAVAAAAVIFGSIPTLAALPAAIAQQMRTDRPNEPRGDGCVAIGVTKTPNGIVYADEDCHGKIYRRRMSN